MEKIDFSYIEMLSEDDDDFKEEFISTFEETYLTLTKQMKEELANKDLQSLAKSAHQLKPSAKMIQLAAAETLEDLQHHPEKATLEILIQIEKACEDALGQLKKWANS